MNMQGTTTGFKILNWVNAKVRKHGVQRLQRIANLLVDDPNPSNTSIETLLESIDSPVALRATTKYLIEEIDAKKDWAYVGVVKRAAKASGQVSSADIRLLRMVEDCLTEDLHYLINDYQEKILSVAPPYNGTLPECISQQSYFPEMLALGTNRPWLAEAGQKWGFFVTGTLIGPVVGYPNSQTRVLVETLTYGLESIKD